MKNEKSYLEKRINTMKRQSIMKGSSAGMILRVILLVGVLFLGKIFIDWSVNKSYNHIDDYELQAYINGKYKILIQMRTKDIITKEELQHMSDSIRTNAKRDFIIERR